MDPEALDEEGSDEPSGSSGAMPSRLRRKKSILILIFHVGPGVSIGKGKSNETCESRSL